MMGPVGFWVENFEDMGGWGVGSESNAPVDASGVLVDGAKVDGPVALRKALLSRPETFATTLTEKLMTYALGRGVEYSDTPSVRRVVHEAARNNYRFASLIVGIAKSAPFQMKRTEGDR